MHSRYSEGSFRSQLSRDLFTVVERVLFSELQKNLIENNSEVTNSKTIRYLCLSIGKLYDMFLNNFALSYKKDNRILFTKQEFLEALRELGICSPFKFKGKNPRRCKIIVRRVNNHEYKRHQAKGEEQSN